MSSNVVSSFTKSIFIIRLIKCSETIFSLCILFTALSIYVEYLTNMFTDIEHIYKLCEQQRGEANIRNLLPQK